MWAFLVTQSVKNPPAMLETWVQFLGREDPLEKNPLQYSCLENSRDIGAWSARVHGVSRVRHNLVTTMYVHILPLSIYHLSIYPPAYLLTHLSIYLSIT